MRTPWQVIREMTVPSWGGLRSIFRVVNTAFYPTAPAYDNTALNYDLLRQLYRNDGDLLNLGSGFCRPIVDRSVEFIGIPSISSDNEALDEAVNNVITKYWKPQIQEMLRNAIRDSKTFVRIHQDTLSDPLVTMEEKEAGALSLVDPERVTIIYDPQFPSRVLQATIITKVAFKDPTDGDPDPTTGHRAQIDEHEIWEMITPEIYKYYDKTERKFLTEWERENTAGFVPIVEVFNEYDSTLSGGQSDLESVYPFVKAFHEVLRQALQAHKYHSTPKLKFQVENILNFMKNNFPDTVDETGAIVPNSTIKWQGKEVLFLGAEDDIGFIEAKSVLGDSKELLTFLIDCIAIASETPEEFFMRSEQGVSSSGDKKILAFEKKIERKRNNFQPFIQRLIKMHLVLGGESPETVEIIWDENSAENVVNLAQALQQTVMSLEVLLERKIISDNTAREALSVFRIFRRMKGPKDEAKDAQNNVSIGKLMADQTIRINKSQPPPAPLPSGGNGGGSASGRKALTSGSNSGGKNN